MEQPPFRTNGNEAHPDDDQARVRTATARLVEEAVRLTDRSPRKVAAILAEAGYFGRAGEPYTDGAIRNWMNQVNTPPAWPLIYLAIRFGLSIDEYVWGSGLRAEVDRLRAELTEHQAWAAERMERFAVLEDVVWQMRALPQIDEALREESKERRA